VAQFPRDIRQREAINAFLRLGGRERTGKGSHRVVKMPNGANLSVPSGVLKVGLLKHLVRVAEVSEEAFLEAVGRR
jgi:predicted RNA binding protein YcfA (HicA-like mRNA interferase family)